MTETYDATDRGQAGKGGAPPSGRFITLEGGEGAGKSTQARLLAERLRQHLGYDVVITREPGGSPFAEQLRAAILADGAARPDALALALAFYAARADHLAVTIRPALDRGTWVICDRFNDSTRIYQGAADGLATQTLDALDAIVVAETTPDLTFVLDLPVEDGMARVAKRRQDGNRHSRTDDKAATDMFEAGDRAFHGKLRAGFADLAAERPHRCVLVDATQPPDAVAAAIWKTVAARFHLV